MTRPQPNPLTRQPTGSALIFVVTSLVLMTMLGLTYIQTSRQQRQVTAVQTQQDSQRINVNIDAVVQQIKHTLRDDLLNDNGDFFNSDDDDVPDDEAYDYPWTNAGVSFDVYRFGDNTKIAANKLGTAAGGEDDDMWLASSTPDFSTTPPRWPHITNLNGVYLYNGSGADTANLSTGNPWPVEVATTKSGSVATRDTSVDIDSDYLVDADGDGIKDSRWTWAPIPRVGNVAYVMAVRIVDNSSMINVNTATAMTSDGSNGWGPGSARPVRGYTPTAADLSRLLSRVAVSWSYWSEELALNPDSLIAFRGVATLLPTPIGLSDPDTVPDSSSAYTANGQIGAWFNYARLYGYPAGKFSIADEFELRYRGGLNRLTEFHNIVSIDLSMDDLLRDDDDAADADPLLAFGQETRYSDIPGISGGNTDEMRKIFFQGEQIGTPPPLDDEIDSRQFPAVRHMLTTISGAAVLAADTNGAHAGESIPHQYDLVYRLRSSNGNYNSGADPANKVSPTRVTKMGDILEDIFTNGTTDTGNNVYTKYLKTPDPDPDVKLKKIAYEYALAIHDYSDADSIPTPWTDTGDPADSATYYGLETLPFVREVYCQAAYEDRDREPGLPAIPDGDYDTWEYLAGSEAMAIEIANPFDRNIRINIDPLNVGVSSSQINLRIKIGTDVITLDRDNFDFESADVGGTFTAIPPADTFLTLGARQRLVIYSNPAASLSEGGSGADLKDIGLEKDFGEGYALLAKTTVDGQLKFGGVPLTGSSVVVELQVQLSGDDELWATGDDEFVTYDRFNLTGLNFPGPTMSHGLSAVDPTLPQDAHAQGSVARDGRTVRYLSNIGKGVVPPGLRLPVVDDVPNYRYDDPTTPNDPRSQIGRDLKGIVGVSTINGDASLDNFQIPIANHAFFSVAELGWIHMFGFTDESTGDFPQRFDALPANRRFLDFSAGAAVPAASGVPHAATVMDHFTTLSPRWDKKDNDNDDLDLDEATGADNDEEQFVPGRININTVPLHLATLAAPLPESVADVQDLMEQIADYRDKVKIDITDTTATHRIFTLTQLTDVSRDNYRLTPGIASIGELMFINPGDGSTTSDMQRYGYNGSDVSRPEIDLYPVPETVATAYNLVDSTEESLARFQFLSGLFTTRSDIYTAYVLILGFPIDNFKEGPVESARFMAVFDRSRITGLNDEVRVLGVQKLK